MWEQISLQSIVDVFFVATVVAVCLKALAASSNEVSQKSIQWKNELLELHASLKELIGEASVASENFDKRLLRRREELEALLEKLETVKQSSDQADLPNKSWEHHSEREMAPLDEQLFSEYDLSIAKPTQSRSVKKAAVPASPKQPENERRSRVIQKSINSNIELTEEAQIQPQVELSAPNVGHNLDPMTLKIARRLIAEGHEIHVIARKLELPLSQVRILDRMIRNEMRNSPAKALELEDSDESLLSVYEDSKIQLANS